MYIPGLSEISNMMNAAFGMQRPARQNKPLPSRHKPTESQKTRHHSQEGESQVRQSHMSQFQVKQSSFRANQRHLEADNTQVEDDNTQVVVVSKTPTTVPPYAIFSSTGTPSICANNAADYGIKTALPVGQTQYGEFLAELAQNVPGLGDTSLEFHEYCSFNLAEDDILGGVLSLYILRNPDTGLDAILAYLETLTYLTTPFPGNTHSSQNGDEWGQVSLNKASTTRIDDLRHTLGDNGVDANDGQQTTLPSAQLIPGVDDKDFILWGSVAGAGVLLLIIFIVVCVCCCIRKQRRLQKQHTQEQERHQDNGGRRRLATLHLQVERHLAQQRQLRQQGQQQGRQSNRDQQSGPQAHRRQPPHRGGSHEHGDGESKEAHGAARNQHQQQQYQHAQPVPSAALVASAQQQQQQQYQHAQPLPSAGLVASAQQQQQQQYQHAQPLPSAGLVASAQQQQQAQHVRSPFPHARRAMAPHQAPPATQLGAGSLHHGSPGSNEGVENGGLVSPFVHRETDDNDDDGPEYPRFEDDPNLWSMPQSHTNAGPASGAPEISHHQTSSAAPALQPRTPIPPEPQLDPGTNQQQSAANNTFSGPPAAQSSARQRSHTASNAAPNPNETRLNALLTDMSSRQVDEIPPLDTVAYRVALLTRFPPDMVRATPVPAGADVQANAQVRVASMRDPREWDRNPPPSDDVVTAQFVGTPEEQAEQRQRAAMLRAAVELQQQHDEGN